MVEAKEAAQRTSKVGKLRLNLMPIEDIKDSIEDDHEEIELADVVSRVKVFDYTDCTKTIEDVHEHREEEVSQEQASFCSPKTKQFEDYENDEQTQVQMKDLVGSTEIKWNENQETTQKRLEDFDSDEDNNPPQPSEFNKAFLHDDVTAKESTVSHILKEISYRTPLACKSQLVQKSQESCKQNGESPGDNQTSTANDSVKQKHEFELLQEIQEEDEDSKHFDEENKENVTTKQITTSPECNVIQMSPSPHSRIARSFNAFYHDENLESSPTPRALQPRHSFLSMMQGTIGSPFGFNGTMMQTTMFQQMESCDIGLTINSEQKSPFRMHSPFKIRKFKCDPFGDEIETYTSQEPDEGEIELSFGSDQKQLRQAATRQVPNFSIRINLFR